MNISHNKSVVYTCFSYQLITNDISVDVLRSLPVNGQGMAAAILQLFMQQHLPLLHCPKTGLLQCPCRTPDKVSSWHRKFSWPMPQNWWFAKTLDVASLSWCLTDAYHFILFSSWFFFRTGRQYQYHILCLLWLKVLCLTYRTSSCRLSNGTACTWST